MSFKKGKVVKLLPIHGLMNLYAISSFGSVEREAQTTKNKIYNTIIWSCLFKISFNGLKLQIMYREIKVYLLRRGGS